MAPVRRLAALLVSCVMLVLLLVESGFACAMPDTTAMATADGGAMAGMPMDMPAAPERAPAGPSDGPSGRHSDDGSCRFPWAPSGCRDMAPCAPAALAVAAWLAPPAASAPAALAAARVTAPPSVIAPPELPPPRA
jgi:hypothetical protein